MSITAGFPGLFPSQCQRQEQRDQESRDKVDHRAGQYRYGEMTCYDTDYDCGCRRRKSEVEEHHLCYDGDGLHLILGQGQ